MFNWKKNVVGLAVLVIAIMSVFSLAFVNAAEDVGVRRMMSATATYQGKQYDDRHMLEITENETNRKISVKISDYKATASDAASKPDLSNLAIYYSWDADGLQTAASGKDNATITIPSFEADSTHVLQIEAVINDNDNGYVGQSNVITMIFTVEAEQVPITVATLVKVGTKALPSSSTQNVGTELELTATTNDNGGVSYVYYQWDGQGPMTQVPSDKTVITIPTTFEPGSTHKLEVYAKSADGTNSIVTIYTITIPSVEEPENNLDIEPWMNENDNLNVLSIFLRNEAVNSAKANKNIFALNEDVVYYVDYKNGGNKITKEVKIVLELPLDVEVVDADGGTVSGRKITWTYPNGLEKDAAGTKRVVVRYISLGKSSVKSKIIYPVAIIYAANKVADSSTVINLIFKDENTEITSGEHTPYMHGDAEADTFRPDDGISRAEGALVLTRIFGMNTSKVKVTEVFSDLSETYEEAQKAIVAATKAGLVNGYADGTYRPNQKMTRAEFMKIIAGNIELAAKEEKLSDNIVDGLRVKDIEELLKLYKDPTKTYIVNGESIAEHWASPYVTLLARLNMTDLTEKNKDLRLDEEITRAEVAQLVNFYLFRAPAEVTSKTKSGFSDVNSKHKLFADIIEATRAAHTYTLTVEGTEVAVED